MSPALTSETQAPWIQRDIAWITSFGVIKLRTSSYEVAPSGRLTKCHMPLFGNFWLNSMASWFPRRGPSSCAAMILVSPGSDGNKIFVPALCEQLLNLCLGSRRNKMLGNCCYRSMSFLCPSERLFAAKDTYRKADRDPNELLHTADYNGAYGPTPLSSYSRWRRAHSTH